jgi:hypothetical protein
MQRLDLCLAPLAALRPVPDTARVNVQAEQDAELRSVWHHAVTPASVGLISFSDRHVALIRFTWILA